MLDYAVRRGRVSERKARLFAVACCRWVWPLLTGPARHAVEVAERFADGLATEEESRRAEEPLQEFIEGYVWPGNNTWADEARPYYGVLAAMYAVTFYEDYAHGLLHGAADSSRQAAFAVGPIDAASADGRCAPEWARQGDLVRCIFDSPFGRPRFDPVWRTPVAVELAARMYESRVFDRMPELAAVREQAGWGVPEALAHCREPGPHVRGCWPVDLVFERE